MAPSYKVLVTTFAKLSQFYNGCATAVAVHTSVLWFDAPTEAMVAVKAINDNRNQISDVQQKALALF